MDSDVKFTQEFRHALSEKSLGASQWPEPVAVIIGQLQQGGSERQLYMFLAHCDRKRWAPVVYVSSELGFWEAPIRALDIPIVLLKGGRFAKMSAFRAACIAQGAKCFFSWSSYTNGFGLALAGLGIRRIGSLRNTTFDDLPSRFRVLWSWMSLAGVSTVVCNSRETQATVSKFRFLRARQSVYIPNGVDVFPLEQIRAWRQHWRARLDLNDRDVLVIGVGRLTQQKNFARFVDVIAQLNQRLPVKAVIAGKDDGCLAELRDRSAQLGLRDEVRFIGVVDDARELICAADIYLLSSDYEGMPNVVLEAMASGTPCVVTPVNSVSDLIDHGSSGFIAAFDSCELARYAELLARDADLRIKIGERARATIESAFDAERSAQQLWALCE